MRRPVRYILNPLAVLSLLLCIATVVFWVWSNHRWMGYGRMRTMFPANDDWVREGEYIDCREGRIIFGCARRVWTPGTYVRFDEDGSEKVEYDAHYELMDSAASIVGPDGRVQSPDGWDESHQLMGFFGVGENGESRYLFQEA